MTATRITPAPQQAARLNDFERGFVAQCHPLEYRTICTRIVCDPVVDRITYASIIVVCECADVQVMWIQDGGRKTVYRLCAEHGLIYNGHLSRVTKASTWDDRKRRGNSRNGWAQERTR